jgi:hypothetical protein
VRVADVCQSATNDRIAKRSLMPRVGRSADIALCRRCADIRSVAKRYEGWRPLGAVRTNQGGVPEGAVRVGVVGVLLRDDVRHRHLVVGRHAGVRAAGEDVGTGPGRHRVSVGAHRAGVGARGIPAPATLREHNEFPKSGHRNRAFGPDRISLLTTDAGQRVMVAVVSIAFQRGEPRCYG